MRYFTERIGRGKVRVFCPVPAGEAAFLRAIDADVIRAYRTADLIVMNGAGYEKWTAVVSLPESRIVDTAKPLADEFIEMKAVVHRHGEGFAHTHGGTDGHTWLDPVYARTQAEEIKKAMAERFPAHAAEFEDGFSSLAKDLDALDRRLRDLSKRYDGRPILASHPSYNYLARRYGWDVVNLNIGHDPAQSPAGRTFEPRGQAPTGRTFEPRGQAPAGRTFEPRGQTPDSELLSEIRKMPEAGRAGYLLWASTPNAPLAKAVEEEFDLKSIVFSPCEELSEEEIKGGLDYLKVMNGNVDNVSEAFAPDK